MTTLRLGVVDGVFVTVEPVEALPATQDHEALALSTINKDFF